MSKATLRKYLDSQIPGELKDLRRWCNWRLDDRGKKTPLDGASSTNPSTWLTYEQARDRYVNANGDGIKGLWFATGPVEEGDELAIGGLDFDHCVDESGEITDPRVEDIIRRLATYAEYSPTDGVRILGWFPTGTRSIKREKLGFEFYCSKRWLSVTGNANLGTPRELDVFDSDVPKQMLELWTGATEQPRKPKPAKSTPKKETSRRFEDSSGVPVDQMTRVAKKCLKLLSDERADEYSAWVEVLCALRWVYEQTDDESVEKLWHKFSKRCEAKYDSEDTQKRWDSYEAPPGDERLTIASLLHWASEDSGKTVAEILAKKSKPTSAKGRRLLTVDAGDVKVEPVRWLWHNRIPRSKLTLLVGNPGDGKSFATMDFAARIAMEKLWPDGSKCPHGRVLIVNTEDAASDTIVPRLLEAGYDVTKRLVKIYHAIENEEGQVVRLNLSNDLPLIEDFLVEHPDTQMVVIDPLASFSGERDFNSQNMYQVLGPLQEISTRHEAAVLGIVHMNKSDTRNAKYRVSGSTAILAAARCAWIVLRDPENEDHQRRLFLPLKMNNSDETELGLAFRIESPDPDTVAHVEWLDETIGDSADDVLKRAEDGRRKRESNSAAIEFLKELLKDGPVPSKQVEEEAKEAGTSISACRKHKDELKIVVRKMGMDKGWCWMLPEHATNEGNPEDDT